MDTTKLIRITAGLYLASIAAYLFLSFALESSLPPPLKQYLDAEFQRELTLSENIMLLLLMPVILVLIGSLIGITRGKHGAKSPYIFSYIAVYMFAPFFGPYVDHAVAGMVGSLSEVISGVLLALLFFTTSAFNKSSKRDAQTERAPS